MSKIRQS